MEVFITLRIDPYQCKRAFFYPILVKPESRVGITGPNVKSLLNRDK